MKNAVQFGAGNIGRGFIGVLLEKSGYKLTFVDINDEIINKLNKDKKYSVNIMDIKCHKYVVNNVDAINSKSIDAIQCMQDAEIITTAVGVNILKKVAPIFANTIKYKYKNNNKSFLNIIACENAVNASDTLKVCVLDLLDENEKIFADKYVGFINCSVDRIVPPNKCDSITDVVVENYYEWNVEKEKFKGDIPKIDGMNLVENLTAYVERKLFTLNTGHAITAYIGHKKGYSTIEESINDIEIYKIVKAAMMESGEALIKKYSFDKDKHLKYIEKILNRFKNPYLKDDVSRVGREPLRKLGKNDRLIKPLNTALDYDLSVDNLIYGIAYALCFEDKSDKQSIDMQADIKKIGIKEFINKNIDIDRADIVNKIINIYEQI